MKYIIKKWNGKVIAEGDDLKKLISDNRANLSGANLYGADMSRTDLYGANLYGADLSGANLYGADLSRANLSGANLYGADLSRANLYGANLSGANLSGANLYGADLSRTDLYGADLSGADLSGANLYGADLSGANLSRAKEFKYPIACPDTGDFTAWKKCLDGVLIKLLIPAKAKRCSASGRKCRAEYVKVLEVIGAKEGISKHDSSVKYVKGKIVRADKFDENRWNECSGGIHFFITKQEAEDY